MSLALVSSASALAFFNTVPANPKAQYVGGRFPGPGEPSDVRPGYVSGLPGDVRAQPATRTARAPPFAVRFG